MNTDFNASAISAGALMSTMTFEIPPFQREYAWTDDEYGEFWDDIKRSLHDKSYFLGLIILTGMDGGRKQVVDGQQRLITLTLLASALHLEAQTNRRAALADRIKSDFLQTIDYHTDALTPRIVLSDTIDNETLQQIVAHQRLPFAPQNGGGISERMRGAYDFVAGELQNDLRSDPFGRLGVWADFLTNRLEFAVFVHPDPASAYRVFEVINTRGKELTTADLLKNYILGQTPAGQRESEYHRWQALSRSFPATGNTFVQYIRHVVTVWAGHVLPKELFDYLAQRKPFPASPRPPAASELVELLEQRLPLYLQMVDPTLAGPATPNQLRVFAALNDLGVVAVRPLLLAIADTVDPDVGMEQVLNLVVRRIVVGNLGTGNVERRLGDAAHRVLQERSWEHALTGLRDLDPRRDEFVSQVLHRSFNKGTLQFLRRSVVQSTRTPETNGWLHYIRPRQWGDWPEFTDEDLAFWGPTIGNTILINEERRPAGATTWDGARENLLPRAVDGEWIDRIRRYHEWDADSVEEIGSQLAAIAAQVWY